jgi:phage terminase large subunit-like protein
LGWYLLQRQNGKTILLRAILGWYITVYAPKQNRPLLVITTAHKLDLAVSLFQDVAPLLKEKFGAQVKYAYGRNQLVLGNCTWVVRAATPAAGHGLSADLLLVDEVWGVSQEAVRYRFVTYATR